MMEQAVSVNRRFFNRDLSWLDFNERVLGEGLRRNLPPLERFKFLSIVSSNLDEFFMVRVAALKRAPPLSPGDPSGLSPEKQLALISEKTRSMVRRLYGCLRDEIFPALARGGLELARPDTYSIAHMDFLEARFMGEIYPVLTPLRVEETPPAIENLSLYAAFLLSRDDDPGEYISIIQIPPVLDRIIWLPPDPENRGTRWALLEDVISTWAPYLFPGYRVKETMFFKVNRDADFSVDEQRDEDFIEAMEEVIA
ncbi:MAG: polyphosphate kinase 1, partial [Spirochaetaceae bacterium]|nr:polyphosphate kinase 1 [Spirochaetaceae bacterium]